jgi:adenylate kinase family enzyme
MHKDLKIHVVGASGSGTTTLAKALAENMGFGHFDTDDYYWKKTDPPYTEKVPIPDRIKNLKADLSARNTWTLSGSLVSWGESITEFFNVVVFIYLPPEVRLQRIIDRENTRYGNRIKPGGDMYKTHLEFIEWAKQYDDANFTRRSRVVHEQWLSQLSCPVIRIEGVLSIQDEVEFVKSRLKNN